ncbi:MAG: TolC family protein [Desulfobacteraceae bacterium]|jgi:outer membrane protein|nr:TolC family protein [Desulfobacteraceae bacterium]
MKPNKLRIFQNSIVLGCLLLLTGFVSAEANDGTLNLRQTIEAALEANLDLQRSRDEIDAATANRNAATTQFLPTLNARYGYIRRDNPTTQALGTQSGQIVDVIVSPEDEYNFVTSFSQPIFTGFSLYNRYKIADLGLDIAEFSKRLTRQNVILDAKNAYYLILKAQKLMDVADDTVKQIAAQKEVAENMYQVGMSPLNDLLQSQVQLANAKQGLITAANNLEITKSQFNTLLRRPVNAPVSVVDILDYTPWEQDIDYCLAMAEEHRLEIEVANLEVQIAEKDYKLSEGNYFPSVNLTGTWTKRGTDWDVDGGTGISDKDFWDIRATASWDFWQWGRTRYGVREKLSRLSQAKLNKQQLLDNIDLEVKQAYLRTQEAQKNITTIEKAIEQAKENLRITEERYKEQVSTTTDVLVAQTLLTETMTNYYNALYDFKIAKAILYRALGQEILE